MMDRETFESLTTFANEFVRFSAGGRRQQRARRQVPCLQRSSSDPESGSPVQLTLNALLNPSLDFVAGVNDGPAAALRSVLKYSASALATRSSWPILDSCSWRSKGRQDGER